MSSSDSDTGTQREPESTCPIADCAREMADRIAGLPRMIHMSFFNGMNRQQREACIGEEVTRISVGLLPVVSFCELRRDPSVADLLKRRIFLVEDEALACTRFEIPEYAYDPPRGEGEPSAGAKRTALLAATALPIAALMRNLANDIAREEQRDRTEGAAKAVDEQNAKAKPIGLQDVPDDKGYVALPTDPSAYVPLTAIVTRHSPVEPPLTKKQIVRILEDYGTNKIRWTRPLGKDGEPRSNRRSIHLADWLDFVEKLRATLANDPEAGFPPIDEREMAMRKYAIDRQKRAGK